MRKKWLLVLILLAVAVIGVLFFMAHKKKAELSRQADTETQSMPDIELPVEEKSADSSGENTEATQTYSMEAAKININVPIMMNIDGNSKETYMKALETGVAHMLNTALPGQPGNAVIFGHSSYYANKPGDYKEVFASLDKLAVGDTISIKSDGKSYAYKITGKKIVRPSDLSVLAQDKSKKMLTLITCWPVNTTTSRYVVQAVMSD